MSETTLELPIHPDDLKKVLNNSLPGDIIYLVGRGPYPTLITVVVPGEPPKQAEKVE